MKVATSVLDVQAHSSFEDVAIGPDDWSCLLARGDTDTVFLTWAWQRAWWDTFGRGKLLLVTARDENGIVAVAPFFADGGMVFFVGSGGSDYLDFVGDVSDSPVLASLLKEAMTLVPGFLGFRLYHVPDHSRTGDRLQAVSRQLGLVCYDEGSLPAPALTLTDHSAAESAIQKKSLRRHERWFIREGELRPQHFHVGAEIKPHLAAFFEQHISRWAATSFPSLFTDPRNRAFYERLTEMSSEVAWLRFTRLDWNDLTP